LKVEPEDLLRISIHSINQEAAAPFTVDPLQGNMQQMMMQQGAAASSNYPIELFNGYLVDRSGGINLPVVGNVPVAGKTIEQIEDTITTLVKPYLKDAVVNVRFLNLKVNVLGEVNRPGIVRMSNQRLTILEALANAGDFSPYANRTNVLLVREENGQRFYHRYNFQSNELFASPYFYLKQNDLVYVEPIKARVATVADPFQRGISYGTAFLSVITLFVALFR
jgi:polysaccharide export outer membrane protein